MSTIWSQFETDKKLEVEGIWIDFGDYRWLCRRAGGSNTKFKEAFARETKKVRQVMDIEDIPDHRGREILYKTFADTVVLDWEGKGMVGRDGKPLPFNRDNVVMIFENMPDFYDRLRQRLMDHQLFLKDIEEASIKK